MEKAADTVSSLGTLLIFAMLLPGVLGFGVLGILAPQLNLFGMDAGYLVIMPFVIGFCSNIIGHATGVLYRNWIYLPAKNFPFELYDFSYRLETDKAARFRKDVDYWFSYYCWYWNSCTSIMMALALKLFLRVIDPMNHIIDLNSIMLMLTLLAFGVLLFYMAHFVLNSIVSSKEKLNCTRGS